MVKNKKLSKSSIAIIVLAVLLIASLVMGMTGAWFTSRPPQKSSGNLKFGTVSLAVNTTGDRDGWVLVTDNANHPYLEATKLMPGDEVNGTFDLDNGGDAAWVFMTYGGTVVRTHASLTQAELEQIANEGQDPALTGEDLAAAVAALDADDTLAYRTQQLATVLAGQAGAVTLTATGWTNFDAIAIADWTEANLGNEYVAAASTTEEKAGSFKTVDGASIYYIELAKDGAAEDADQCQVQFHYALVGGVFGNEYFEAEIEVHVEFVAVQAANLKAAEAARIAFADMVRTPADDGAAV